MKTAASRRHFVKSTLLASIAIPASVALPRAPWRNTDFSQAMLPIWERAEAYTLLVAEAMPAEKYGFRPVPEVRSFAGQMLHLAGSIDTLIGDLSEVPPPFEDAETEDKVRILDITRQMFAYGGDIIRNLTEEQEQQMRSLFGGAVTLPGKERVLFLRDHITHHRGQLVIYLRLNDIEPPQYVGF